MEGDNKTILIIEDEPQQREALQTAFERGGYRVEVAADGDEGLRKVREHMPCVVLLDLLMPVLDGFAFLEALNGDAALKRIPVVVLTNLTEREKTKAAMDPAKDYFFTKTNHTLEDIVGKVKHVCLRGDS
ncbi:hypothetical protein A3C91_00300 [Candidatus Azambacteria bacterium RIFCSPHIGHO2_02_FULL_52_12]|uniref:Response regulatory domain-containing protein n=1 Tax=Candidatus Azambacteria bacterium RIFCSPLOWO2_01_FULL_46_25 TaxID=1797298 RepID=A0A1F5BUM2_9BACT|nr:MAG: hypothetical protein A3C91_00300 [Candidatus Azambacteria bacterium RIFCSPHIGHO2_02_FULL_52_12]OGD34291.1 MAG: hypothetical protein A2988_02060 [Candidatus Azambacteria bacterium RIFCSPLOWO2_01_FULL_46_25]OGD36651.1 MAG: hypothetical protein A2850_03990 [Candidatus Azambacteria bacterium RIFCSPHIGHO2_01_FULL_51_74]